MKKMNTENRWEKIYLIGLSLFIVGRVLSNSLFTEFAAIVSLNKVLLVLGCGIAAGKLLFDFFGKRLPVKVLILILIPVFGCVYFLCKGKTSVFMFLLLFSAAGFNVDYDRILKWFAWSLAGTVAFVMAASLTGIIGNYVMSGWRNGVLIDRASCGFHYFYEASHYTFFATAVFLYFRRERAHIWEYLLLLLFNFIVFQKAATKTPFFIAVCIILGCLLLKLVPVLKRYRKTYGILAMAVYPVCAVFIFLASILLDLKSPFGLLFDSLTSGRLSFNSMAFETYGLSPLGNVAGWSVSEQYYNLVDSSYLSLLYEYGYITLIGILAVCAAMGYFSRKREDTYFVLISGCIAVYAMFDSWLIRPECNVLLFAYPYIYSTVKKNSSNS